MTYIIITALAISGMVTMGIFNKLVRARNEVKNFFSQIDVQLKRRYDLIPNLVETVKGFMAHEKETLEKVILARNQAFGASRTLSQNVTNPEQFKSFLNAEGVLNNVMSRLMVVMEQYPDLKANTNMMSLMEELTSTENRISFARQAYNDSVMEYNNTREIFPNIVLANMFGFTAATSFEIADQSQKENVKVSFS